MDRIALITGGSRGIGFAIAEQLEKDGFKCVAADLIKTDRFDFFECDISSDKSRRELLKNIEIKYGRLDLLVNNAGVACKSRLDILETTEESFDRLIDINLKGTFFMCQLFANHMRANLSEGYSPRIVNISSISAYTSSVSRGEYCISKAGISMATLLFADRLAEYGIPVFEVRPGIILTDMTKPVQEKYEKLISEGVTPIKRFGSPTDVANMVSAAASGKLDFGTGTVLNADGGFHIRRL